MSALKPGWCIAAGKAAGEVDRAGGDSTVTARGSRRPAHWKPGGGLRAQARRVAEKSRQSRQARARLDAALGDDPREEP